MHPKCQASPNPDEMMNPDIVDQATEPPRASLHKRSASDSVAMEKKPCLVGEGSFQSPNGTEDYFELNGGDADGKAIDHNIKQSEDSSSSLVAETHGPTESPKWGWNFDPDMDPKKIKRLLANRVSAQKSRLKKLDYIEKLKRDVNTEEAKISVLAPQVAFYQVQRMMLQKENEAMKQRMEELEKQQAEKDAQYQALKDERDMLALTYFLQQEGI